MAGRRMSRKRRQLRLQELLEKNPFYTDEELAEHFGVSVQTIRLDRIFLGIPELRERMKHVAEEAYAKVKSMTEAELIGELIDIELGSYGISVLEITPEMVLQRTSIARGHFLFAQANSLAVALVDAETVLTGSARVRYKRPVYVGEKVVAKARVKVRRGNSYLVSVYSTVNSELVFKGQFIVMVQESTRRAGGGKGENCG
ncbi:transcription factor FapR [Calderihabitans maritimus]|uniref:Transcription factor FapR n=1 Tax=Calderihabitans maritimus TaxID=1246530 RepID=A0A1Z5HNP8_9FIRM|nr:transcription factor FapR [Calderihabitans maritimus]GAW91078.1 uncharacterized protein MTY_2017 [Calderihabitans maritimus]